VTLVASVTFVAFIASVASWRGWLQWPSWRSWRQWASSSLSLRSIRDSGAAREMCSGRTWRCRRRVSHAMAVDAARLRPVNGFLQNEGT